MSARTHLVDALENLETARERIIMYWQNEESQRALGILEGLTMLHLAEDAIKQAQRALPDDEPKGSPTEISGLASALSSKARPS